MKAVLLAVALIAAIAAPAWAETRCREQVGGTTVCRDDDGHVIRGRTDANGETVCR